MLLQELLVVGVRELLLVLVLEEQGVRDVGQALLSGPGRVDVLVFGGESEEIEL